MNRMLLEIEDMNGNTIGAISVDYGEFSTLNLALADVDMLEDGTMKYRLQMEDRYL